MAIFHWLKEIFSPTSDINPLIRTLSQRPLSLDLFLLEDINQGENILRNKYSLERVMSFISYVVSLIDTSFVESLDDVEDLLL